MESCNGLQAISTQKGDSRMNYKDLLAQETTFEVIPIRRAVDKNGHFYHAVQRAANRDNIFDIELA